MHRNTLSVLVVLLCGMSCDLSGLAQEFDQALPPLVSEEYTLEGEATAESDVALWTPAFLSGSSSAMTDALRQGHVYWDIDFAVVNASDKVFKFGSDQVVTPRIQIGWELERGFGLRGRYWSLQNVRDSTYSPDERLFTNWYQFHLNRKVESIDLECYQRLVAGRSEVLLGSGLRGVRNSREFQHLYDSISLIPYSWSIDQLTQETITGIGITFTSELKRPLLETQNAELALLINGRTSYLPAQFEVEGEYIDDKFDDTLWINEGAAGLEVLKRYKRFAIHLRGLFETQYWNGRVTDSHTFTGTSLSFGVDW